MRGGRPDIRGTGGAGRAAGLHRRRPAAARCGAGAAHGADADDRTCRRMVFKEGMEMTDLIERAKAALEGYTDNDIKDSEHLSFARLAVAAAELAEELDTLHDAEFSGSL